jgi:hypothetical protein
MIESPLPPLHPLAAEKPLHLVFALESTVVILIIIIINIMTILFSIIIIIIIIIITLLLFYWSVEVYERPVYERINQRERESG